jgi:lysosomal acid lipase/cholesteryl ester hydrolase
MSHIPAGTSTKNFVHWSQMVRSGLLVEYDYKKEGNLLHYGTVDAPVYDIRKINNATQIYLYWSPQDWLADEKDVTGFLLTHLPQSAVVENNMLLDFNHVTIL